MLVMRAQIHKMLVIIASREDPDPTVSEVVGSWSALFVYIFFGWQLMFENLEHRLPL